ncbi:MAG: HAMP domain-containing histidine kinase [Ruminococcus sp.]|nr:HAMP domain-containing histidine kinase [Ruminococcus sp.]
MKDNKVIKFLKMTSTRVVAFVTACVILAVCSGIFLYKYFSLHSIYERYNSDYLVSYNGSKEKRNLFTDLWLVGNMYLSRLDDKGKFNGSKELLESTKSELKKLGLMDDKGKITIRQSNNFDWYVAWNGKNEISSNNKSFDEIYSDDFSYTQINGNMDDRHNTYYYDYGYGYGEYYTYSTNYGMTYYYSNTANRRVATAVFDFDTEGLNWYIDNNGAKIYYKTDGTTPIPYENDYYYGDEDVEIFYEGPDDVPNIVPNIPREVVTTPVSNNYEEVLSSDYMYIYNPSDESWIKIDNDSFQKDYSNEYPLTICITPKQELISNYKAVKHDVDMASKSVTATLVDVIPFVAVVALLMGYVLVMGGYSIKERKFTTGRVEKIYGEFILAGIIACFICVLIFIEGVDYLYEDIAEAVNSVMTVTFIGSAFLTVVAGFCVLLLNSLIRRLKCHIFWNTTIVKKILVWIFGKAKALYNKLKSHRIEMEEVRNNRFTRKFLAKLGIFMLFETIAIASQSPLFECAFIIAYAFANLKDIGDITNLSKHISRMNKGDYTKENVAENSVAYGMNENLNNISDGLQNAVEKRLQSERMKIDLVTNVSHDLKTPLTSIISYINLLSAEELSPVARDYVKILENKSARLSEIVADVFDIAKATSRTDIKLEMIDAVILTEQVIADMSDKIDNSGRDFRKTISADSAPVYAEGKRLYRVLQNIIDNAMKYSLENTRVYLNLERVEENVVISVKNISSYEIKFTPEEITERFTRGDKSRTSDGNGLGLSIAKSFTEACGGEFKVIINGDLFEADIILPIKENFKVKDK